MRPGALIVGRLRRSWVLGLGAALAALAALVLVGSSTAAMLPSRVRIGSPAPHPPRARVLGALSGSTAIQVNVALKPRDPAGLAAYAAAVATPGSGVYHHFLTVAQFRQRFGPGAAQIAAVEDSLRAHGLAPGRVLADGLSIPVSASAARMASAFSVSFNRVALPSGRTAFANAQAPQFDANVAGDVQGVVGLDSISVPTAQAIERPSGTSRPHAAAAAGPKVVTGGPQPCRAAVSTAGSDSGYTADQLASSYQLSGLYAQGDKGAGQTIALYELEPNSTADIAAYQTCYGTNASVSYVQVDGGAGSGTGVGEAALDIEDVIGLAPQANVVVYQGPNSDSGAYDTYARIVSDDTAQVISTSWGLCEADEGLAAAQAEASLFEEAAAQGQSVFAAAGDNGSQDCSGDNSSPPNDSLAVDDPASQPDVTGVGGTTLSNPGPPASESVWNESVAGAGAGGGGISTLWSMPSYQSGAPSALNVTTGSPTGSQCGAGASGYCREVPDVSADADPYTGYVIYWNGSWGTIGGTSAAAPLWAAYMALVNASSYCAGSPVGFANPALYAAAASNYSSDFSDVTTGDNDYTGTGGGSFGAGTGYDMASGLGTPIGASLAADLCAQAGGAPNPITVTNPGGQSGTVGAPASLQISASDSSSGATLSYSATGLPAGLSIDPASGLIAGAPATTGPFGVTVTVSDGSGASRSVSFEWTVSTRSTATSVSCSPGSLAAGATTRCTATAADTGAGLASAPAGAFRFATTVAGSFSGGGWCTLVPAGTGTASCSVTYQPASPRWQEITAFYSGDATHSASSGGSGLTVSAAPASSDPPAGSGPAASTGAAASRAGSSPSTGVPGCPAPSGRAGGSTLGLVKLGLTRSQARRAYAHSRDRASRNQDIFCLTTAGVEVGYASGGLLRVVPRGARAGLAGRVVWIATANPFFALDGVRSGTALSAASHRLKLGSVLMVGTSRWYLVSAGGATVAFKAQGGVVREIGLAARSLTSSRSAQRALLSSF